jgi:phosphatidylglycerol---prolipoprotein diacylglyceryl transferase
MFNILHNLNPTPILISFGQINVYWYGIFIVTAILAGILVTLKLAEYYKIDKNIFIDSAFILIITGVIGARLYHVILEFPYYFANPLSIFKLWQGGLAIHGAIIAGVITIWYLARSHKMNFWFFASLYLPGMALAQSIGRWGNYFNQELFGKPTNLPWGIPITPINRVFDYYNSQYFHPAFLYESIGSFIIFVALFSAHRYFIKNKLNKYEYIFFSYLIMYSGLRFLMEFIRIDPTPSFLNLRIPQLVSLIVIIISIAFLYLINKKPALEKNVEL